MPDYKRQMCGGVGVVSFDFICSTPLMRKDVVFIKGFCRSRSFLRSKSSSLLSSSTSISRAVFLPMSEKHPHIRAKQMLARVQMRMIIF